MKKFLFAFSLILLSLLVGIGCLFYPPVQKALFLGVLGERWGKVELESIQWGLDGIQLENFSVKNDDFSVFWERLLVETSLMDWLKGDLLTLENIFWQGAKVNFSRVKDWKSLREKYLGTADQPSQAFLGYLKSLEKIPLFSMGNCFIDLAIHLPKNRVIKLTVKEKSQQGLSLSLEEPVALWRFQGGVDWERTDRGQWEIVTVLGKLVDSQDRVLVTKGTLSADQEKEHYQLEWNAPDYPSFSGKLWVESDLRSQQVAFHTTGLLPFSVVKMGLPMLDEIGSFTSLSWNGKGTGARGEKGLVVALGEGQFSLRGFEDEVISTTLLQPFPLTLDLNQIPKGEFLEIEIKNQLLDPLSKRLDSVAISGLVQSLGCRVSHYDGNFSVVPLSPWKGRIDKLFLGDSMVLKAVSFSTSPTIELKGFSTLAIFSDQTVLGEKTPEMFSGSFQLSCDWGLLGGIENTKLDFKGSGDVGLLGKQPLFSKPVGAMKGSYKIEGNLAKYANNLDSDLTLEVFSDHSKLACNLRVNKGIDNTDLDFEGSGDVRLLREFPLLSKLMVPMDGKFQIEGNLKKNADGLSSNFLGALQHLQRWGKTKENLTALHFEGSAQKLLNQWESAINLQSHGEGPNGDMEFSVQWEKDPQENPNWKVDWQSKLLNIAHCRSFWGFFEKQSETEKKLEKPQSVEEQPIKPSGGQAREGVIKGTVTTIYANGGNIKAQALTHQTTFSDQRIEQILTIGSIGGGKLRSQATLDLPSTKVPQYQLGVECVFSDVDWGILQGADYRPSQTILAGKLSGEGIIKSKGETLKTLASNLNWKVEAKSNGGNFRVFSGFKQRLGGIGTLLDGGAILGGFFNRSLEKIGGNRLNAIWRGVSILQDLPYDELSLSIQQKSTLDPIAFQLDLKGDPFQWESDGVLLWNRKNPWQENRLHLMADLGTRGELADALDALGLLAPRENQPNNEYLLLKDPIEVEGKLGNLLYEEFLSRFVNPAVNVETSIDQIQKSIPITPGLNLLEELLGL